jgi:hypothetical protein
MTQVDDLSRSLITFEQNSTMVVVLEMSQSSWLAAGVVPGIERRPLKKLDPDPTALVRLVEGWRDHAGSSNQFITLGASMLPIAGYRVSLNAPSSVGAAGTMVALQAGIG